MFSAYRGLQSIVAAFVFLSFCIAPAFAQNKNAPAAEISELQPLDKYAGDWNVELTIKSPQSPDGAHANGASKGEWIHGGRFLRQTWSVKAGGEVPAFDGSIIRTFDPRKNEYRSWTFDSNGMIGESVGRWDEKSQKFTWTVKENALGGKSIITSDFSQKGVEEWAMDIQDSDGKTLSDVHGKAQRKE